MEFITQYRQEKPWEERLTSSLSLRNKHPDRVPVIVDRNNKTTGLLEKNKLLVPEKCTMGEVMVIVRNLLVQKISASEGLYLFVKDYTTATDDNLSQSFIPPNVSTIGTIYKQYQDKDGNLYLTVSQETTFGK